MQCQRCGKELGSSSRCNFCGYENFEDGKVREMSQVEKNFYSGVTIEQDETNSHKSYSNNKRFNNRTAYINLGNGGGFFSRLFEKFVYGLMNGSLLAKIIAGLVSVALIGIFFFVAIPIMFFMLALGIALFFYARFRGKV